MNGDYLNCNNKMMAVKVEPGACCSNDNNNNEVDEIKSKFKFKNNVKCNNKCFNLVDKWINKAIVRVPTGDNWHNIIQREIALLKVRYPFLTEKQLKGKALVKFGIPCFMGNIVRTGDKKVTGALAKELLRTRVKNSRVPAAFKASNKVLSCVKKLDVPHSQVSTIENYLESNSHDIKDLKTENKMFQQLKSVDDNSKLRNPYHSNDKENDCPDTPRKKRIHGSIHVPLRTCYDNDDPQTPTKKFKLEPTKPEDRRLLKFVTQAANEVMVDSDTEPAKSLMKPDCSPSPLTKDLMERIKKNPMVYIRDRDANKSDLDGAPLTQADENDVESNFYSTNNLKTDNKMLQPLKSVDDNLKLRNPYHPDDKENDCPDTPRKKRIHGSTHVLLNTCYDNDDPQTPTKKFKLEPTKRDDRRLLKFVTQAANEVMVDSDTEPAKSLMKPDCSPSPLTKDLMERIKNNPMVYIWDRDADKSDLDGAPLTQADENLNAEKNDGNEEILTVDLESASLTESLDSSEYPWPAGQRLRESMSLEKLDSTHKSFEKLSLEDDSDLITISPIRKNTQDFLRMNLNNNVVSPLTQDTLSIKLSSSLDHDYAKDDATQLESSSSLNSLFPYDSRIFSMKSNDINSDNGGQSPLDLSGKLKDMDNIFTPPSLPSQDINSIPSQLFQDSFLKNSFNETEFSEDEFSEYPADSSKQFMLSDLCDEFSEGWRKVPCNRSVLPSTDIREEMNRISMEEIKQNVTQIIDYLYADSDTD
ncbi:uncharacterized protein LOC130677511 [Microplitis mediator]|uniref:uncharacterized protein LOC130677511 n=1 Tax=Microplitis mediator TaxID=375433 RepID=UPI002554DD2D|nr:uncharacterized protein LOC130677511 [Microplitis mediator]